MSQAMSPFAKLHWPLLLLILLCRFYLHC